MVIASLLTLYLLLLGLLALVSAMETATSSVRDMQQTLSRQATDRNRAEVQAILANPFHHLHRTLLVSATLNLALTALGIYLVTQPLRQAGVNVWLGASVLFGLSVLLGDVAPKLLASWKPVGVLFRTTQLLSPVRDILDPLTLLAERASDCVIRILLPQGVKQRQFITRDELETLIEMRQQQGAVTELESDMLAEVLEMTDFTVKDCMTPRTQMALISEKISPTALHRELDRTEQRFAVVYRDTPDQVLGVVDIPQWKLSGCPAFHTCLKPPVCVHETASALETFSRHLSSGASYVLIIDEYGGLEGMLTQEEIIDWVLYDAAPWQGDELELRDLGGGRFLADGSVRVSDAAEILGAEFPENEDIDTLAGLVLNEVGYLPSAGRKVTVGNVHITVKRVSKRRIQTLELRTKDSVKPGRRPTEEVPA
jgi:putative hemolysin